MRSRWRAGHDVLTRCKPLLGTYVEISVPGPDGAAAEAGFEAAARVHALMSFHSEDSDLARLRRARPGTAVAVAPETFEVLALALELHRVSDGLFDVTVGRALVRGGFLPLPDGARLWDHDGTSADLELCSGGRVICHRPMLIDLGGIAKGFAVDRALESLARSGLSGALVNAGGDMRAFGPEAHPVHIRRADGRIEGDLMLRDAALASSDNSAARRRVWGRLRTPHIGRGERTLRNRSVVSVLAPSCMLADAMTKIAMADATLARRMLAERGGMLVETERGAC